MRATAESWSLECGCDSGRGCTDIRHNRIVEKFVNKFDEAFKKMNLFDHEPDHPQYGEMIAGNYQILSDRLQSSLDCFHAESALFVSTGLVGGRTERKRRKGPIGNMENDDELDAILRSIGQRFENEKELRIHRVSPRTVVEAMVRQGLTPWTVPLHGGAFNVHSLSNLDKYIGMKTIHFGMDRSTSVCLTRHAVERFLHYRHPLECELDDDTPRLPWMCDCENKRPKNRRSCEHVNDADPLTASLIAFFVDYDYLDTELMQSYIEVAKKAYDNADFLIMLLDGYPSLSVYVLREVLSLRSMILLTLVMADYEASKDNRFMDHFIYFLLFMCKIQNAKTVPALVDSVRLWNTINERMHPHFKQSTTRHTASDGFWIDEKDRWTVVVKYGVFDASALINWPESNDEKGTASSAAKNRAGRNGVPIRYGNPGRKNGRKLPVTFLFDSFRSADHRIFCYEKSCTGTQCIERDRMLRYLAHLLDLFNFIRKEDEVIYPDEMIDLEDYGIYEEDLTDYEGDENTPSTSKAERRQRRQRTRRNHGETNLANLQSMSLQDYSELNEPGSSADAPPPSLRRRLTRGGKIEENEKNSNKFVSVKVKKVKVRV